MTNFKKAFAFLLTSVIIISGTGCNNHKDFVPKLYDSSLPTYIEANVEDNENNFPESKTPKRSLAAKIKELYSKLCEFYNIEKDVPEIRQVTADDFLNYTGGIQMDGCYDNNTIYVLDTVDLKNTDSLHTVVHELLHYLSDNGEYRGFRYKTVDGNTLTKFFNEGATDYLASKFVNELVYGPYDYQRLLCEQLASIVGEENFQKAYFSSNVELFRNLLNSKISDVFPGSSCEELTLDTFETFVCNFNTLWAYGNFAESNDSFVVYQAQLFSTLEEEVFYLAYKEGKIKTVRSIFSRFCMQDYELNKSLANEMFNYDYLMSILKEQA